MEVDGIETTALGPARHPQLLHARSLSGQVGQGRFPGSRVIASPPAFPGSPRVAAPIEAPDGGGLAGYSGGTAQAS
jgi:hypothetical protein